MSRFIPVRLVAALCLAVTGCSSDKLLVPIAPPALSAIGATAVMQGATATLVLTGSNFVPGATTVVVSGTGVTVTSVTIASPTSGLASLVVAPNAPIGARSVAVMTVAGTSGAMTLVVNPPPPTLAAIVPSVGVQGTTTSVTLTGTNFVSGATTIAVSGSGVTAKNVVVASATTMTADFTIDAGAALADRTVTVTTAGGTSGAQPFTIKPAAPTLASVSPPTGVVGTIGTLTLTGTNFVPGATVLVSGAGVTMTGVAVANTTTLTVNFAISTDAALGDRAVTVATPGGVTGGATFTVVPPTPAVGGITPAAGVQGTVVAGVVITGTNFIAGATSVAVSGTGVTTSNINVTSPTSLTVDFTIAAGATLGARNVTITTAGGTSSTQTFTVNPPVPTLDLLSPAGGVQGHTIRVVLMGTNFAVGGTTVTIGGAGVTPTNVNVTSTTSITADFAIVAGAALGARSVTVSTASGTSGALTFTVIPPGPALLTVTPSIGVQGNAVAVTLTGTDFVAGSTVSVSGAGVAVSNVNVTGLTSLTATFTLDVAAALGARDVTVTTPGGTTGAQTFTVNPPPPTLASVSPAIGVQGTTVVAATLTGTNFVAGATVTVSGTGVTTSNVNVTSATSLTVDIAVDPTATLGARTISVATVGGPSGTQTFTVKPPAPTLASVAPNQGAQGGSQTITLTGTNFLAGATTVNAIAGVTVSNVNVTSATQLTATFAVDPAASLGGRTVTVSTAGGNSATQPFTVVAPPSINAFNALATHLTAVQPARLRWATTNATTCSINNGVGVVTSCTDSLFVTPGTTKTYTLSATGSGVTVTANFQLFANEPGQFVYWTTQGGAAAVAVHQFKLDATTGDLTPINGGTVGSGTGPHGIAVDPSGSFAYVANLTSGTVSMYGINRGSGALTSLGAAVSAGTQPIELAVDPTSRFVYVINNNGGGTGSISQYTIGGTGVLTGNGTTTLGTNASGIAIDPTGRFLYATNRNGKSIQEFSINPNGTLSSLGTVTTSGFFAQYMAIDPTGRFLYLTHDTDGRFSQYSIGANGTLTLLGGAPVNIGTGTERPVAVDPTGRFAYILDYNNAIVHEFSIDQTTGILTHLRVPPTLTHFGAGDAQTVQQIAIDPQGKFVYGTDNNHELIILFSIDANGFLAPVAAPLRTLGSGTSPWGIVVSR